MFQHPLHRNISTARQNIRRHLKGSYQRGQSVSLSRFDQIFSFSSREPFLLEMNILEVLIGCEMEGRKEGIIRPYKKVGTMAI